MLSVCTVASRSRPSIDGPKYIKEATVVLMRDFQMPDEEMKKIVLKGVQHGITS